MDVEPVDSEGEEQAEGGGGGGEPAQQQLNDASPHRAAAQQPIVVVETSDDASATLSPSTEASGDSVSNNPEQYHFVEESHSLQVLEGLRGLLADGLFCDMTLVCGSRHFPCHKLVLSSFSPYFRAMFSGNLAESNQREVEINEVEPSMLGLLVDYAYTAQVLITRGNVQALLSAANLLQVHAVTEACCRFMQRNMDESNCLGIHCFAEAHACAALQEEARDFALRHFRSVCQEAEFLELSAAKLTELVASDDLCASNEEIVFEAALRWLKHDPGARTDSFGRIVEQVRLALLTPYFLHDVVAREPAISESPTCRALLEEARTFHLLPDRRGELRTPRTRPRKASGLLEVVIAVGGEDDKVVLRSVESYDPATRQWRTLACLPFAVSKHGLVVNGQGQLYMAGGEFPDGSASRSLWRYDACVDKWQEMAALNMPRSELGLALLDGSVYAVGGWEGTARLDSVERYCPDTNTWSYVAPMKIGITSPAVVAHRGMLYVTGGAVLEDGDGISLVQCYNPRTDAWTNLAPMLIARSGSAACVLNGCIYVIGGWHASTENTNKVERYVPGEDRWELRGAMCERRYRPGVAVVHDRIYVCGGEEGWDRYHDTIECYDESVDQWTVVGEMPSSRSWLSCVAMTIRRDLATRADKTSICIV